MGNWTLDNLLGLLALLVALVALLFGDGLLARFTKKRTRLDIDTNLVDLQVTGFVIAHSYPGRAAAPHAISSWAARTFFFC
jgi:hypothetical protein